MVYKIRILFFRLFSNIRSSLSFSCFTFDRQFFISIFFKIGVIFFFYILNNLTAEAQKAPYFPSYSVSEVTIDSLEKTIDEQYKQESDTCLADKIRYWAAKRKLTKEVIGWIIKPKKEDNFCFFHIDKIIH